MKHLSGMDNLFLAMERGTQYMHVGGLGIYDPATAPGGKVRFKQVLDFFTRRLDSAKVFRRRLVHTPLGLDRPHWIEDADVDVEFHVRHVALPAPGDWRQLMIQVARIHSRPLDRSKPLWEAYIIEGLDNIAGISKGSFALYIKFHHAAVDGEAGAEIIKAIHALSADLDTGDQGGRRKLMLDRVPMPLELYARAAGNRARQAFDATRLIATLGQRLALVGKELLSSGQASELGRTLAGALARTAPAGRTRRGKPLTRFDRNVSAHRIVDAVGFPLADCKLIRDHVEGVTINDIFVAAAGGAVRKYLDIKGELPAQTLNALMPMSTRGKDKYMNAGNQIGMVPTPLRSDIADPLQRLLAVKRGSTKAIASSSLLGKDLPARLIDVLPALAAERAVRQGMIARSNITVSNVRGPDVPLYMAGAQLQLFLPVSIAFHGVGLNITGFSYHGTLWVCFVACRDMLPDPALFARCLNESFAELVAAARAQKPSRRGPEDAKRRPASAELRPRPRLRRAA